jgi:hypothetical protein
VEAAGRAVSADLNGNGFEQARGDQAGAFGVEIEERVGGLAASERMSGSSWNFGGGLHV